MKDKTVKIWLSVFGVYFVAGMSADRIGYLMTDFSFNVRVYGVFPVFMVAWYVFLFKYEWDAKSSGTGKRMTAHEVNLQNFQGEKNRIKMALVYIVGCPVILAALAWLSIGTPAYLTKFFAKEPFVREYLYTPNASFIADGYKFQDVATGENVSVRRIVRLYRGFPEEVSRKYNNEIVCLQGRTSVFGTIVQNIKPGRC